MSLRIAAEKLRSGDTAVWVIPHGNSMTPRIKSGEKVKIEMCDPATLQAGDVVLCVVRGVTRLHLVSAIDTARRRVQISNNHGYVNGWTSYDKVYGKMTEKE